MARKLRVQFPGALYHVVNRGNYRRDVFESAGAAQAFVTALEEATPTFGWRVHAYVVMCNHYHFVVETPMPNLVSGMHWLQSTLATRFNRHRTDCTPKVRGDQCATLRGVEKGRKGAVYTQTNAPFHWGVTPPGQWVLCDVKKDPTCQTDLAASDPNRVKGMSTAYDQWWDEVYPVMIERGGDAPLTKK